MKIVNSLTPNYGSFKAHILKHQHTLGLISSQDFSEIERTEARDDLRIHKVLEKLQTHVNSFKALRSYFNENHQTNMVTLTDQCSGHNRETNHPSQSRGPQVSNEDTNAATSSLADSTPAKEQQMLNVLEKLIEEYIGNQYAYLKLMNAEANVRTLNSTHGDTALHQACQEGHCEIVKLLIEHGADVNAFKTNGFTLLILAAESGSVDCVMALINAGANVRTLNPTDGNTALHQACQEGHTEVVKVLLEHGADVNAVGYKCLTSLLRAAANGHVDCIMALIGAEARGWKCVGLTMAY